MKNILVCGATGFMGTNIAKFFSNNYNVYGVSKNRKLNDKKINFFNYYLISKKDIEELFNLGINFDIVIQAAATTSGSKDIIERPYLHVTDNAVMNALLLQACYDYNVEHFLFLSCGVMYNPDKTPVKENDFSLDEEMFPNYFGVGWTKVYVEKMCEFYSRLGKTKHTVIRHSNTYGPHDKYDLEKSHMFGATITKVMNANDGDEIIVWGDGTTERDLLYVDDVVNFIDLAILNQEKIYDLYNVGMGKSFSVNDIVNKIIKISGKNIKTKNDLTKPSINTKLAFNSEKAYKELGWEPKYSLTEGVKLTIDWYNKNKKG